jgi:serine/threonine protein kinase
MTLGAGTKLGPYEILAPLGAGGMGEVYRSHDSRLRRDVALKLVPALLARNADALARFEREAQTVAALPHPNIAAIFDVGRQEGFHYLVMELVEGDTLRERLSRGPLPTRTAVDVALQASRGLAAAHAKGVVHRDLKPENLLLTGDHRVKILDFGLARQSADTAVADQEDSPTLSLRTEPGTLLGTVGYMSPEQARGRVADARSDIFAMGAVLCEMLTGERAFGSGSQAEALSAILRDEPRGMARLEHDAPPALVRVVGRCLQKSADERFQSAGDLVFALEALATRVAARTSSFAFKGKNQDLREIAEKLGVSSVLEGSVRRAGSRLRITAQLIDAKGGHHVWSERYDREVADVFAIQDEIAEAIAGRLRVTLAAPQGRVEPPTRDPEAYDLYLKGRHFFNQRAAPQAIAHFEEAIARDPDFASAYTGLSDSYGIHAYRGGIDTRVAYAGARAAVERARDLAPGSAEVNLSTGILEHYFGWDFVTEERELSEALRRSPRSAGPRYWLSLLHGLRGRLEEALPLAREAAHLEPLSPYAVSVSGWALLTSRRFDEASAEFRKGLEIDPNAALHLEGLCRCQEALGNTAGAVATAEKLAAATDSSFGIGTLARAYACGERVEDARRILAQLGERAKREYVAPYNLLPALVSLGDWDEAFHAGERACDERNALAWWGILYDPACDGLRKDARFPALAARTRAR